MRRLESPGMSDPHIIQIIFFNLNFALRGSISYPAPPVQPRMINDVFLEIKSESPYEVMGVS